MLIIKNVRCEKMLTWCINFFLLAALGPWAVQAQAAERAPAGKPRSPSAAAPLCRVAEFRALALSEHDPSARSTRVRSWLLEQARGCSLEKLSIIRDNRAVWLGTADTAELAALVDGFIEAQSTDGREILKNLYGGSEAQAHAIVGRHGAAMLLVCPNHSESTNYRARNPGGFYDQLAHGKTPAWLTPLPLPRNSPLRLFKVD